MLTLHRKHLSSIYIDCDKWFTMDNKTNTVSDWALSGGGYIWYAVHMYVHYFVVHEPALRLQAWP